MKNEIKDQGLWLNSESQRVQLCVGPSGRQVGYFVFHTLLVTIIPWQLQHEILFVKESKSIF
jgi:hypothetical protein